MTTLADIKPSENIKVLLCGTPGTGKTCAAIGFPYPILALDFDNKINSAAAWYANDPERLKNVEVRNMSRTLDGADPIADMNKLITEELIPQQKSGKMKHKTLLIDSATTFSAAVMNHIIKTNPAVKRFVSTQGVQPCQQDFGILKREFAKLIPGLLTLPMNIVFTAHIEAKRSEITGEILRKPILDGSFGEMLPIYFEEVYVCTMKDGKPFAQTKSDATYNFCRSQIPGLPASVELKYESLTKKYK